MPRPAKLNGTDKDTKLLGTLVHWVMHNNLLTKLNTYSAIQASRDFDVSYAKLKRVITGIKQHGGSYYERLHQEQEEDETKKSGRKRKALNLEDGALAKKKKVSLSDTAVCKYCGKSYHSSKKLMDHINKEHTGEQTIFACLYCSQPFNHYSEYLEHLGEHKDKVIRCRLCNKQFKTITKLRQHTKSHVNQCLFCSVNFTTSQALQDHMNEDHGSDPATVERQCPLCEFTCDNMEELAEHSQSIHCPYSCNICFLCFSAEYKLADHRCEEHEISSMGTSVEVGDQSDQVPEPQQQEPVGATKPVEPTPEVHNPSDQALELLAQKEPQTKETEVPPGGIGQQVELDEEKGSEA